MSTPATRPTPLLGGRMPVSIMITVVFAGAVGAKQAKISPGCT